MNVAAASGAFASAITAPTYKARLLGSSRMVEAPLRHVWVMVANNIKGSPEILRRCVMIELDAHLARPEMRTEWHHADIRGWVSKNRGRLVSACLVLVQNWVAKGKEPYTGALLGSFENWSRVMGGILRDAEVAGFLGNTERLRSYAATDDVSGVQTLIDALSEYPDGTAFRAGGDAPIKGQSLTVVSIQDELNRCGESGTPLLLDGWGYSRDGEGYTHARGITCQFRDVARVPWETVNGEVRFEEFPDPKSPRQSFWVMRKR